MSEQLYTCPACQRTGFLARGLTAHECPTLGRRLSAQERLHACGHVSRPASLVNFAVGPAEPTDLPHAVINNITVVGRPPTGWSADIIIDEFATFPMSTTTTTLTGLFQADPQSLVEHPALAQLPPVRQDDPGTAEFLKLVEAAGEITEPIRVDEHGRLVDGRRRRLAAQLFGLPLPALRCKAEDAATLIFNNLAARRNLDKSTVLYFAWPLVEPLLLEARARRVECLKRGDKPPVVGTSDYGKLTTAEQVAKLFNVSRDTLFEVAKDREYFAAHPELAAEYEPRLLSGDITLGRARQGAAGKLSTAGQERAPVDVGNIIQSSLGALRQRFSKWANMPEDHRSAVAKELGKDAAQWPEEAQREVFAALKRSLKSA